MERDGEGESIFPASSMGEKNILSVFLRNAIHKNANWTVISALVLEYYGNFYFSCADEGREPLASSSEFPQRKTSVQTNTLTR